VHKYSYAVTPWRQRSLNIGYTAVAQFTVGRIDVEHHTGRTLGLYGQAHTLCILDG
jgi:hypothetical protein